MTVRLGVSVALWASAGDHWNCLRWKLCGGVERSSTYKFAHGTLRQVLRPLKTIGILRRSVKVQLI